MQARTESPVIGATVQGAMHKAKRKVQSEELLMASKWRHELGLTDHQMKIVKGDLTAHILMREQQTRGTLQLCTTPAESAHVLDTLDEPLRHIRSTHLEFLHADKKFNTNPILPYPPRILGSTFTDFFTATGHKRVKCQAAVHEVPLFENIRRVLSYPAVQQDLARHHDRPPNAISDVSDGVLWKKHELNSLFPIYLGLYNDAVEYVNAIGAFRSVKKIIHWYVTILNLSPAVRNDAKHMILAASCFEKTQKCHGVDTVVSGVRYDAPWNHDSDLGSFKKVGGVTPRHWIKDSSIGSFFRESYAPVHSFPELNQAHESTGLGVEPRPVVLLLNTGDRLAVHAALRCKESFSPLVHRVCHCCDCPGNGVHHVQDFLHNSVVPTGRAPFKLRSSEDHISNLDHITDLYQSGDASASWQSMFLGLNPGGHMFVGIPGFSQFLIEGSPGDIQHIELEGNVKVHVQLLFRHLVQTRSISHMELNSALKTCVHEGQRVNDVSPEALKEDSSLHWTSGMALTFVIRGHHALQRFIDRARVTNPRFDPLIWQCWLMHAHYVCMLLLDSYTEPEIRQLNDAILGHHTLFKQLHADSVGPKFHFVLHLPRDIVYCGPGKHHWCMRAEAKHQVFKRMINRVNFKNILQTLTETHQRLTAYSQHVAQKTTHNGGVAGFQQELVEQLQQDSLSEVLEVGDNTELGRHLFGQTDERQIEAAVRP